MKNIYILIIILCMFSCTKTKTVTVTNTVIKHDTTIISYRPSLIGKWISTTGVSPVVFDSASYAIQTYPSIRYIASIDTVYNISPANIAEFQWSYKISSHNDSLILTMRATGKTDIYLRN